MRASSQVKTSDGSRKSFVSIRGTGHELAETRDAFLEFEEDNSLFALEVRDQPFWDCIRLRAFEQIAMRRVAEVTPKVNPGSPPRKRRPARYAEYARTIVENIARQTARATKVTSACDLCVINYDRLDFIDGQRVNKNCFPVVKELARTTGWILVVDPYDMRPDAIKRYPANVVLVSGFGLLDNLKAKTITYTPGEKLLFREVDEKINQRFGTVVDVDQLMRTYYRAHIVSSSRYRRLFERHRLKGVVVAHRDYGATEAAHKLGVPVIELQHSMISTMNLGYNYPRSIESRSIPTLPDAVLTFGDYWNDKVNWPSQTTAVGYPFFESKAREVGKRSSVVDRRLVSRNLIVISSYRAKAELVRTAIELSSLIPEITIFFKLKESDYGRWTERYPKEFWTRPNIRVIDSDDVHLYEYFSMCSWVLGVNSGALYEAIAHGVSPLVLRAGFYEESRCLYEHGDAVLVENASQIGELIMDERKPKRNLDREKLYKSDGLKNMVGEIHKITTKTVWERRNKVIAEP